jgi:hypothetical protein
MDLMSLPCGGIAAFDVESGISYRCMNCFAVVGSIGMPQHCKDEIKKWDNWAEMGGKNWDYKMPDNYMDDWS